MVLVISDVLDADELLAVKAFALSIVITIHFELVANPLFDTVASPRLLLCVNYRWLSDKQHLSKTRGSSRRRKAPLPEECGGRFRR